MIGLPKITVGLGIAIALASVTPASAGTCGRFGGWGIGVTESVAKFMSNKAMHQALAKESARPLGAARTECNTNAVLYVQCHTFTKACSK